jgi:hypothetical protein
MQDILNSEGLRSNTEKSRFHHWLEVNGKGYKDNISPAEPKTWPAATRPKVYVGIMRLNDLKKGEVKPWRPGA